MRCLLSVALGLVGISAIADDGLRPLDGYRAIMWVSGSLWKKPDKVPLVLQRLREMGVNTGMITGDADASAFVKAGMPYYVENIVGKGLCLKYNSPVTNWSAFVNGWMKTRDEASLVRPYSLDDPEWNAWAQGRMRSVLRGHKANAPVLADIRDELSTTISANPFDYDFSPQSLAGFRVWLKTQYAGLAELNHEWETDFPSWEDVRPFTTDQIKARMVTGERLPQKPPDWSKVKQVRFDPVGAAKHPTNWNFSPWCDFRSYMDTSLARALSGLRKAAREADPGLPVGIEGTQMPHAFGGYDLWQLSQSVDWMEPYDVANAREILGSFMPRAPFVTTVFEKDTEHAMRRLWHLLLLGDQGCVVWWSEDCVDLSKDDCPLTPKARALAPALKEMTSPLARLFMKAERESDPIAIHYSQASIQCAWLLESAADGQSWPRRFSSYESGHNRHAAVRNGWLKLLQDAGYSPRFVSSEQIEDGELERGWFQALVLPDSLALSGGEYERISHWALRRRKSPLPESVVVAASLPGLAFDGSGRLYQERTAREVETFFWLLREDPYVRRIQLLSLHPDHVRRSMGGFHQDVADYGALRATGEHGARDHGQEIASGMGLGTPSVGGILVGLRVRTHRSRLGGVRLLAFERNVDYHMSEDLKQAGGNEALEKPVSFEARLKGGRSHVYELRTKKYLGETDRIAVELDPWRPSLFALLPEKLADGADVVDVLSGGK